jgi:hypothetical protein
MIQGPIRCISPLVAVPKANDEVLVSVDIYAAGKRSRHSLTPPHSHIGRDGTSPQGGNSFLQPRPELGYHQNELHPDSRWLTTFSTPQGLKRNKRLIFGFSSASETYQFVIQHVLNGIPGVPQHIR